MKKIKISKTLLKILSALIAIALWFAITYTEDPVISQLVTGLTLIVKGEQELNANGLAIVNKDSFPTINVVIRGSRSNVISALGEISAQIDVSSIKQEGENVVAVTYTYPAGSVVLEKIKVQEICVETESLVSREIPVKTETVNREKNSDTLIKSVSKTETLTVKGAQSDIYEIAYAKAKIDASKITKTSEQECVYEFYNEENEAVSGENITYRSRETVLVENTVYEKVSLPIKVVLDKEKRDNFGLSVKNISTDSVDAGLDGNADIEYIEAVVSPQKEKNSYEAVLIVPEGVYIPEENLKITVSGEIVPKELKEVNVTVEAVNVPSGAEVTIIPKEQKINVKTIENVNDITVKATVDVSEAEEAQNVLAVKVTADGDTDIIGTYSAAVKVEYGE